MKKRIKLMIIVFALSVALQGVDIPTVCASETAADISKNKQYSEISGIGETLFASDLSDTSDFELHSDSNGDKVISKRQDFTDFVLEADITVGKGTDEEDGAAAHGGLLFRTSKDKETGEYNGYYFALDILKQQVALVKLSADGWNEIATKKMSIEYDKVYHATIVVAEDHIICYMDYNGVSYAKLDIIDETYTSGGIGVYHHILNADYGELKVSAYTEKEIVENESYINPVFDKCADPDILYHNGTYYLYCTTPTQEGNSGIKVYTSTDLVHWTDQGFAFFKGDGWGDSNFWAPDIIERDGVFYMYYAADEHLCVATSESPLGPFKQDIYEPMHEYIKEIDAHAFYDEASDKYYLYFVRFTAGNVIWGAELNDDMKSIKEETLTQISRANQGWDEDMMRVNEGPYMLVRDGKYYMTYSGSHFESVNYGAGYAVADSPLGPFTKYENNPIIQSNSLVHGAGHHCVAASPDGKELFMVYHCHHSLFATDPRRLCIDRMQFTEDADGNIVLEVNGPTVTPQELPSGSVNVDNFIEFKETDFEPVIVNKSMTVEEIMEQLPTELLIRTSQGNHGSAVIVWNLDNNIIEGGGEEIIVKGMASLPETVDNLGNIPLDVEVQITFDMPTADIENQEGSRYSSLIWVLMVLGIGVVTIGIAIKYFPQKRK